MALKNSNDSMPETTSEVSTREEPLTDDVALADSVSGDTVQPSAEISALARWAGALLVVAALCAVAATVAFGSTGRKSVWGWGFIIAGFIALGGWFSGRRQQEHVLRDKYARQRTLLGANAFTSVLLLLVLLVGVNYIAARRHKTFDLTSNRANSLADQSYKALEQLPRPVKMTYVYRPRTRSGEPDPAATTLLTSYKNASNKVQVEYLNRDRNPLEFQALNLSTFSGAPLLLLQMERADKAAGKSGKGAAPARQEVSVVDEQNVTSALMKLKDPKPRTLYFLTGHGEADPNRFDEQISLSQARTALESQNYTLKSLSLLKQGASVPADAEAVLAIGPRVDLAPTEETLLKSYVTGRGRLVLFLFPSRAPLPRWNNILQALGLEMGEGIVVDPEQAYQSPQNVAGVLNTSSHALLRGVSADVVFPFGTTPLRKLKTAPPGFTVTSLFESSERSGSASARDVNEMLQVLRGGVPEAKKGPFVLAGAVEASPPGAPGANPTGGQRAVVVGNADFCSDQGFNLFGNSSFFLAAVNWTVGNEALVSIPPKPPVTNTIMMTDAVRRFVSLFSVFALPFTVLILGGVVWWRRR